MSARRAISLLVVGVVGCAALGALLRRESRAAAPAGRFEIDPVHTDVVLDHLLGLTWQRNPEAVALPLRESPPNDLPAKTYCDGLALGGYSRGFRLPTVLELQSIIDMTANPTWDSRYFGPLVPLTPDGGLNEPTGLRFWTGTILESFPTSSQYVDFSAGTVSAAAGYETFRLRCVHD